jgi:hypothetical protein
MTVQPFTLQTDHGRGHRQFLACRTLAFDDGTKRRVDPLIGKGDAGLPMIV